MEQVCFRDTQALRRAVKSHTASVGLPAEILPRLVRLAHEGQGASIDTIQGAASANRSKIQRIESDRGRIPIQRHAVPISQCHLEAASSRIARDKQNAHYSGRRSDSERKGNQQDNRTAQGKGRSCSRKAQGTASRHPSQYRAS